MTYLEPNSVRLWYPDAVSRPRCEIVGRFCLLQVRLCRCFPLTAQSSYISVQDSSGKEVGILRSAEGMDDASIDVLQKELDRRYFTPVISTIYSLQQEASMWKWDVQTQRGRCHFYLRGVRDSVHEVAPRRWQVLSMDGQRYEIRNFDELDAKSQQLFESLF